VLLLEIAVRRLDLPVPGAAPVARPGAGCARAAVGEPAPARGRPAGKPREGGAPASVPGRQPVPRRSPRRAADDLQEALERAKQRARRS
jgi:hypothetical protein